MIGPHGSVRAELGLDRRGILVSQLPVAISPGMFAKYGLTVDGVLSFYAVSLGLVLLILQNLQSPRPVDEEAS